mmetsp:Transcript_15235/g.51219  ORF Transcript_15235/g.51219 Transcript_15235/m.51219 type:complete len:347 (-) Transcript_15235:435-1475(-)
MGSTPMTRTTTESPGKNDSVRSSALASCETWSRPSRSRRTRTRAPYSRISMTVPMSSAPISTSATISCTSKTAAAQSGANLAKTVASPSTDVSMVQRCARSIVFRVDPDRPNKSTRRAGSNLTTWTRGALGRRSARGWARPAWGARTSPARVISSKRQPVSSETSSSSVNARGAFFFGGAFSETILAKMVPRATSAASKARHSTDSGTPSLGLTSSWSAVMRVRVPPTFKSMSPKWSSVPFRSTMRPRPAKSAESEPTAPTETPATGSTSGTPASNSAKDAATTVAMDDEPFEAKTSQETRAVYGKASRVGKSGAKARSARAPWPTARRFADIDAAAVAVACDGNS